MLLYGNIDYMMTCDCNEVISSNQACFVRTFDTETNNTNLIISAPSTGNIDAIRNESKYI